jgi:hypothetical protein
MGSRFTAGAENSEQTLIGCRWVEVRLRPVMMCRVQKYIAYKEVAQKLPQ